LEDKDAGVRLSAVQVVWRYGPDSIPLIVACFGDKDDNVRQNAIWMLQSVQGDLKPALPKIRELLKHENAQVRTGAVALLSRCGDEAADDMLALMRDKDVNVRWQAVHGLRNMQKTAKKLLPALTEMATKDKDTELRTFAIYAMAQLGPDAFEPLFEILTAEKDEGVRATAIQMLGNYGQQSAKAIPFLTEALKDKSAQVRWSAASALGQMGKQAKKVIPQLAELLQKDTDSTVRQHAMYALSNMYPDSMPAMVDGLKVDDSNVRQVALNYMNSYNYRKKDAVPGLIACLKDSNVNVKQQACNILGQMGKDAADAVESLRKLSQDTNPTVQQAAQAALSAIGEPKKEKSEKKEKK